MVARSTWDGAMTVYRYGCPSWADLDDLGMEQLRLAHELRNELVAIEHRYQAAVEATWRLFTRIAETDAEVKAAQEALACVRALTSPERRHGDTRAPDVGTREELATCRRRLREARAARRAAKAELYVEAKTSLARVRQARDAARKSLYATFCQNRGLHWATFNDVAHAHDTAVRQVAAARKQGRPAELRFRRWDGSGTLTVQLQRGAGKPARTFELLSSGGGPWRNVVRIWPHERLRPRHQPSRGTSKHWEIAVNVGRGRQIQLPVVLDRLPHDEADITLVRVTRRRLAGQHRLSVALTARIPWPKRPTGAVVCLHTGWRSMEGDLRVAVVIADRPLAEPASGLPVRRFESGWEVRLPTGLRVAHKRTDQVRSQRDLDLNRVREVLAGWLAEHPQPDLTADQVSRWRAAGQVARIALVWRESAPEGGREVAETLEAWRRRDRRLWEREAHERDQISARIRDIWANVAAWLTGQAELLRVDDTDIQLMTRISEVRVEHSVQAKLARAQRQVASPGELRAALCQAATARGVPVEAISVKGTAGVHAMCGTNLTGEPARQATLWCAACGRKVDQDVNAAEYMLMSASVDDRREPWTAGSGDATGGQVS